MDRGYIYVVFLTSWDGHAGNKSYYRVVCVHTLQKRDSHCPPCNEEVPNCSGLSHLTSLQRVLYLALVIRGGPAKRASHNLRLKSDKDFSFVKKIEPILLVKSTEVIYFLFTLYHKGMQCCGPRDEWGIDFEFFWNTLLFYFPIRLIDRTE